MNEEIRSRESGMLVGNTFNSRHRANRISNYIVSTLGITLLGLGGNSIAEGKAREGGAAVALGMLSLGYGIFSEHSGRVGSRASELFANVRYHISDQDGSARSVATDYLAEIEASGRSTAD